ncbi:hypothetical protein [Wolbachia endosymbiont (group B) of Melanostoma mellinum]|uniref:hypothetical protein n=1 Tax=Wolbachia endosymbiont (group B) of Melanostoma mellinum TaxID=2954030 RepID=UPI0022317CA8|nr:hypothetical protein [Wolbachia endosymbiont (group B) of Melanostoma mellinum]
MGKLEAIKNKYRGEGLWSAAKEVPVQGWDLVKEHKGKTIGISLAVIAVASLTAAYLLSPAYATFVGTVGTKAATLVSPAITAMSAFAVAHPLIASLVVLAAVAALITAPVYAYKNSNKAAQVEKVAEVLNDSSITQPDTKLNNIKQILGLQTVQSV